MNDRTREAQRRPRRTGRPAVAHPGALPGLCESVAVGHDHSAAAGRKTYRTEPRLSVGEVLVVLGPRPIANRFRMPPELRLN